MSKSMHSNEQVMTLGQLLPELGLAEPVCSVVINEVVTNSQKILSADVFVALNGERVSGIDYADDAIARGAAAILVESNECKPAGDIEYRQGIAVISVDLLESRVGVLAGMCLGAPSMDLLTIGVTGTNGKSTCVTLVAQLYKLMGGKAGALGTLGLQYDGEKINDFGMTTPDAATCQRSLSELVEKGADLVAMEVSSHGLEQGRIAAVAMDVGVFTNLTHDHLDYHGTIENYCAAKQKLFEKSELKAAVINLDDAYAAQMLFASKNHAKVYSYSLLHFVADLYATDLKYTSSGVEFTLMSPWGEKQVESPLLGKFNVYNLLAAIAALCASGANFNEVLEVVPRLSSVPGRMQLVQMLSDITVLVDYAHTPDALVQASQSSKKHTEGALWVVFGCGGDRDSTKRPMMAKAVEREADQIIVTSDNPRSEPLESIISDICSGFSEENYRVIEDRKDAIEYAITHAESGDIVLIAGKGHETYQIVNDTRIEFDDVEVAIQSLELRTHMSEPTQGVTL